MKQKYKERKLWTSKRCRPFSGHFLYCLTIGQPDWIWNLPRTLHLSPGCVAAFCAMSAGPPSSRLLFQFYFCVFFFFFRPTDPNRKTYSTNKRRKKSDGLSSKKKSFPSETNVELRMKRFKVLLKWNRWWNCACVCTGSLNFEIFCFLLLPYIWEIVFSVTSGSYLCI